MASLQRKLFLIPFADLNDDRLSLRDLTGDVAAVFGLEGAAARVLPLPLEVFDRQRQQYSATGLLKALVQSRAASTEPHSTVLLGITGLDLFAPRLTFVFGMADTRSSVAVISLCRLRPEYYGQGPEPQIFRQRAFKEAIHELGHIFGLAHCGNQACIMHFSASIEQTDQKGPGFCDTCTGRMNI